MGRQPIKHRVPAVKLGYSIGYWPPTGPPPGAAEIIAEADRLGFDSLWTAEAYGSDALTPLAWWGAQTERMRLGTAIAQISARTPAATAMAAITMDHLSGGRFVLGLGVSGPQVVEGWYGQPFAKPLARTREYIEIVRAIWARKEPVVYEGEHYQLPLPGTELGKPLKSIVRPLREDIPIYLAAEGPKNIALATELCQGWLALFYSPHSADLYAEALANAGDDFEVVATVPLIVADDVDAAADMIRPMYALYFGGMGAREVNFHANVPIRMGYEDAVAKIQDAYLNGRKDEAAAAVPTELVEQLALIGPVDKIRADLEAWRESRVDTLLIGGGIDQVRQAAELVLG